MVRKSYQNVFLIQIDTLSFAEFEISEFEISRFDCFSQQEPYGVTTIRGADKELITSSMMTVS